MPFSDFSIAIEPGEGFQKNDIFGHKLFGERLANLFSDSQVGLTVAIDAKWGEGKSTFLKMWAGYLRDEKFPVIEFNSYVNDYYLDPFIPLSGEIIELVRHNASLKRTISDKAIAVGTAILKGGAKIGIKAATLGALDKEGTDDIAKDIADGISDYTENTINNLLNDYKEEKDQIKDFQIHLSKIAEKIQKGPKFADGHPVNPKPMVFIIDELDRCRPDYALKLLERVKHFYSAPNVHFVLGVHMSQLENSVKAAYGSDIDSRLYLDKFFSLVASLPKLNRDIRATNAAIYLGQIRRSTNASFDQELFSHYQATMKLSLRDIEKFVRYANLNILSGETEAFNAYLTILLSLKLFETKTYEDIVLLKINPEDAKRILAKFGVIDDEGWLNFLSKLLTTGTHHELRQAFKRHFASNVNISIAENFLNWESPNNR